MGRVFSFCVFQEYRNVIFKDGNSRNVTVLGFEDPGDLTLFALSGIAQNLQK